MIALNRRAIRYVSGLVGRNFRLVRDRWEERVSYEFDGAYRVVGWEACFANLFAGVARPYTAALAYT